MKGTSTMHTRAMAFTPPRMTEAVSTQTNTPTTQVGMPKVSLASRAMELACTVQPIPNEAKAVNTAKSRASHFMPSPRSKAYIGPP